MINEQVTVVVKKLMEHANHLDEIARKNEALELLEKRQVIETNLIFETFEDVLKNEFMTLDLHGSEIQTMDVVYLRPDLVIQYLKDIEVVKEDKSSFIEWYLGGLVEFYLKGFKYYSSVVALLDIDKMSIGTSDNEMRLLTCFFDKYVKKLQNNQKLQYSYSVKKEIFKAMNDLYKRKNIPYFQQFSHLEKLHLDVSFLQSLPRLERMSKEDKQDLNASKERKEQKSRNYELKKQLDSFIHITESGVENQRIFSEEELIQVQNLLFSLYPSDATTYIKQVLKNNRFLIESEEQRKRMEQQRLYEEAFLKVVPDTDEKNMRAVIQELRLFVDASTDANYIGYVPYIRECLELIDIYLYQFIQSNQEAVLIPDYYDAIEEVYNDLETCCLPYLPLVSYSGKGRI